MKRSEIGDKHLFLHHENPRFVYIPNLKAGYTSIVSALVDAFPALTAARTESELDLDTVVRDYAVFSFVRHPVARVVSFYVDKLVRDPGRQLTRLEPDPPQESQSIVFNALIRAKDTTNKTVPVTDREVYERLARAGFSDLVYLLDDIATSDRHLYPQSAWLARFPALKRICFAGHVETVAEDWAKVCSLLGREVALPHENRSDYRVPGTRFHLNRAWRQVIERVYAGDIAEFYESTPR
jgi:sulfotransferase famil protein